MTNPNLPAASQLFNEFRNLSELYPQSLIGVASAVGEKAMLLLDIGQMTWDDFRQTQLEGRELDALVELTTFLHGDVDVDRNDRLKEILPRVFDLTKDSFMTSVYELSKGQSGQKRYDLTVTDEEVDMVGQYLFDHREAEDNRTAVSDLLFSNKLHLITRPALTISEAYRDALIGTSSDTFPDACDQDTAFKKLALAGHIRPILERASEPIADEHGLSPRQIEVFTHNITRP